MLKKISEMSSLLEERRFAKLCAKLTTLSLKKKKKKIVSWFALKLSSVKMNFEEPDFRGSEEEKRNVKGCY